jgi:two-component system sensor histidine kinase/response regulator
MLTSLGQPDDPVRLKASGIVACLVKPARQSKLLEVLAEAWAGRLNQTPAQLLTLPTAHIFLTPRKSRLVPPRTLVVDDGTTNQKVGRLMLENLGCRVDVAANGKEAIQMLDLLPYDAVFMDCEMPEMDGYEATAEIRRKHTGAKRLPIIAMTAKAITGDRERCLAAGMDDYISKPVRVEDLEAALQRWIPEEPQPALPVLAPSPGSQMASPAQTSTVLQPALSALSPLLPIKTGLVLDPFVTQNLRSLAEATEPSMLDEIYGAFSTGSVEYLAAVRRALADNNPEALFQAAHGLKGAAANIGATHVTEIAGQLEALGHSGSILGADTLVLSLDTSLAQVLNEIENLSPALATQ